MARRGREIPEPVWSSIVLEDSSSEHTQLLQAIYNNDFKKVSDLLKLQGVKPLCDGHGNTVVCMAAMEGRAEILTLLLDNKGEADQPDLTDYMWQRRPIHLAASHGHIECIDILLSRGVDINCRDSDHRTPLHWASTYGQNEAVAFLISRGASVNTAQIDGFTALHAATCLGHTEVCTTLIQNGADVNRADRDNWTALHTATCYGYIDVARIILDAGASILQRTSDAETAFHIACSSGHLDIVKMLYNYGAQINAININGYTPLHLSVYYNKFEVVHFLVTINADMDTTNNAGQTPLYLAALRGEERVLCLMIEAGCSVNQHTLLPLSTKLEQKDIMEHIQYLAANPRSLKELCCLKIRSLLKHTILDDVHVLPIPQAMKDLIMFKHLSKSTA
ncbi:hypothetical protein ACOMHN_004118 [Nucella lapillus]